MDAIDPIRQASVEKHPRTTVLSGPISHIAWCWIDLEGEVTVSAIDQLLEMIILLRDTFPVDLSQEEAS